MTADSGLLPTGNEAFGVLVVCTANRYRSPLAEHLLGAAARAAGLDWRVRSAGTLARAGRPIDPRTEALLTGHGLDVSGWRSHRLDAALVGEADLILAADSSHRAAVALLDPRARARTFLLLQFARLAEDAGTGYPVSGPALVQAVLGVQGRVQPPAHGADELADPAGDPDHRLAACADRVTSAVDAIVGAAAGR